MKKTIIIIAMILVFGITAFAAPASISDSDYASPEKYETNEVFYGYATASELITYIPDVENGVVLSDDEDALYEYIENALFNMESYIDVSRFGIRPEEVIILRNCVDLVLWKNPELYYLNGGFDYSYYSNLIVGISPWYLVTDKEEIAETQEQINARLDEIIALTDDDMTDVEKLLVVYDEVVMNVYYDDTLTKRNGKELLLDGTAVCQGYTTVLSALADRLDIPCGIVHSEAMNHVWNVVYLDGKWYHVDMTWDDTSVKNSYRVTHKYFLKSNEWMQSYGEHYGFTPIDNDDTAYDNAFWNSAVSRMIVNDDCVYYVDNDGFIACFDKSEYAAERIYTFVDYWWTNNIGYYWNGTYSGLSLYGDKLYFNEWDEILSCGLDGTDVTSVFVLANGDYSIYGSNIVDGNLYYNLGSRAASNSVIYTDYITLTPEGTAYYIYTAEDLYNVRNNLAGTYYLMNDIDLSGYDNWEPIGDFSNKFIGTFDGQGYEISGIYIDSTEAYQGLFGYVYGGTVKNVGVVDSCVKGNCCVGGVVGYNNSGTVENCYNTGTVSGSKFSIGGVVGHSCYGTVENCYNTGDVTGNERIGGVVGENDNDTVIGCYNTGKVSGSYKEVGGVVGNNGRGTVENCYNTGDVADATFSIGGVVGRSYYGTVENCYNMGTLSGIEDVGGVVGNNNYGTVINCYYLTGCAKDGNGVIQYGIGTTTADVSGQTTGLSDEQMKVKENFIGFDFEEIWMIDSELNNGYPYLQSLPIKAPYTLGDITGDDNIDISDAILLFQHSMMASLYPIDYIGNLDFTKDGEVNINDAILLFQHSMMPGLYPLD